MDNNGHKLFLDQIPDFTGIRSHWQFYSSQNISQRQLNYFETQMILDNS